MGPSGDADEAGGAADADARGGTTDGVGAAAAASAISGSTRREVRVRAILSAGVFTLLVDSTHRKPLGTLRRYSL